MKIRLLFLTSFAILQLHLQAQFNKGIYIGFSSNVGHTNSIKNISYFNHLDEKYYSKSIIGDNMLSLSFVGKNIFTINSGIRTNHIYSQKNNNQPYNSFNLKQNSFTINTNYEFSLSNSNNKHNLFWSSGLTANMIYQNGNKFYHFDNLPLIYEFNTGFNYYANLKKSFIKIGTYVSVNPYHQDFYFSDCGTTSFINEYFFPTYSYLKYLTYGISLAYSYKVAPNNRTHIYKTDYSLYNDSLVFNPKTNRNFIYASFLPGRIALGYERLLIKKQAFALSTAATFGFYDGSFFTEFNNHYLFGKTRHKFDIALNATFLYNTNDWLLLYPSLGYRFHSPIYFGFSLAPIFGHRNEKLPYNESNFYYLGVKPIVNFGFVF